MAVIKIAQNSFTGGELSPGMLGRIDDQKYQTGLALCRNFVVTPQGPVKNRSGFAYVRPAKYADKPCRLIPFEYDSTQTMVLEFGDKYVRFHTQGQTLLGANGQPYEVVTPYEADDVFSLHYTQSADVLTIVHTKYAPRELRRYGPTDWRLVEIDFGAPLPAPTGLNGSYACSSSSESITEEMRSFYTIRYCVTAVRETDTGTEESEASTVASVTGNLFLESSKISLTWNAVSGATRYRVYKTYSGVYGYLGETESTSFVDTNIDADDSITPPRYDDPFFQAGGIQSVTVTNGGSGYGTHKSIIGLLPGTFTVYHAPGGSNTSYTYSNSLPPYPMSSKAVTTTGWGANPSALKNLPVTSATGSGAKISFICEADPQYQYNYTVVDYKVEAEGAGYLDTDTFQGSIITGNNLKYGVSWSFPIRTKQLLPTVLVTDSTGTGAELEPLINDQGAITSIRVVKPGSGYTNPTVTIQSNGSGGSGATATATVGTTGDYPGAVSYYQQRRIFAGTSTRPQFVWMTRPGTESDMSYTIPTKDDNRIKFRVAAAGASRISHVLPMQNLMFLTPTAELRVQTSNTDVLTPTSMGVQPQSKTGASDVQPILVGSSAVFAAERGGHLFEFGYNWQRSGFITGDLSIRAAHLFDNCSIKDMTLAKAPFPIIWAVSSSGLLLGCTYLPDQQIGAWHAHSTVAGAFESVACVAEGEEDILYAVVRRTVNGQVVRYVERMHERNYTELEESFFVDCGATYRGNPSQTISGLSFIEGMEVNILADGAALPPQTVANGAITLPVSASVVHVGLPITADLQTLPVAFSTRDGGYGRGRQKNVTAAFVRLYQSSGVQIGPTPYDMKPYAQRRSEPYGMPPEPLDQEVEVKTVGAWNDSGQMYVRQSYPLPLMVCSITLQVAT